MESGIMIMIRADIGQISFYSIVCEFWWHLTDETGINDNPDFRTSGGGKQAASGEPRQKTLPSFLPSLSVMRLSIDANHTPYSGPAPMQIEPKDHSSTFNYQASQ
jgi:hypothetical protein